MNSSFYAIPEPHMEDMEFALQDLERINLGEQFSVVVTITNKSKEVRTINAVLSARSVFYTGLKAHLVKKAQGDFKVKPGASKLLHIHQL